MLKILFNAKRAERHPVEMMLIGFFYATISILLSLFILPEYASLVMVFFTVISCLYVVQKAIISEEIKDKYYKSEEKMMKSHVEALKFLMFLFFGFVIAFTLWTIILPHSFVSASFNLQSASINEIKSLTGNAFSDSGFYPIIINNLKVAFISFLLALFYGAGAIFVLVWNASIMGFMIGDLARNTLGLVSLPSIFLKYFLHGFPEMIAYFVAALAGGILFISLIKGDLLIKPKKIAFDVVLLILAAIFLLIFAALIEVYVSPFI